MQQADIDDDDGLPLLLGTPMEWGSSNRRGEPGRSSDGSSPYRKPIQDSPSRSAALSSSALATAPGPDGAAEEPEDARTRPRRAHDICMVFKCKTSKEVSFQDPDDEESRFKRPPTREETEQMLQWQQRRETILKSLQACGLTVFCCFTRDRDKVIAKIGAPGRKLRDTAARCCYRLQLKRQFLGASAEYRHDFPGRPENGFQDKRIVSHVYQTYTDDDLPDSDAIFKTLDKINLIHHVITSSDKDCAGYSISALMKDETLEAYFPLHERNLLSRLRDRAWDWYFMKEDLANEIRDYFGAKVAFYFIFQAFYLKWLLPIAAFGMAIQIWAMIHSGNVFTHHQAGRGDNGQGNFTTIPYCILISVWSVMMPHFWRRQEAKYTLGWGTMDDKDRFEPARSDHTGEPCVNPVTAKPELHYPLRKRALHYACSAVTIFFVSCMVCSITVGFLILRQQYDKKVNAGAVYFEFCLAVYVEVMNYILSALTSCLTARENHRTEREHEFHMLAKTMVMKFVVTYFALYYIAFFKDHQHLFGVPMTCLRDDCFSDLQSQLAAFVFFRLVMANAIEFLYPRIMTAARGGMQRAPGFCVFLRKCFCDCGHCLENWIRFRNVGGELGGLSATETQANLDSFSAFEEFEEFMISHGLATLFASTSPWVCFAWLVGAILEMKVDRDNLLESSQRPTPTRAKNNEPWDTAFEMFGFAAATTNILLAVFASEEFSDLDTLEKLKAFAYYEHAVLLARFALVWLLPVVPRGVATLKMKQDALVHRVLENVRVEDVQERGFFHDLKNSPFDINEFDFTEEDEDMEPSLKLGQSAKALAAGVLDTVRLR
jgi:hypothetical protein